MWEMSAGMIDVHITFDDNGFLFKNDIVQAGPYSFHQLDGDPAIFGKIAQLLGVEEKAVFK